MLHGKIWGSLQIGELPREARLLFIGIITLGDDDGRAMANPIYLKGQIFPYDDDVSAKQVKDWRDTLAEKDLIVLYEVEGSEYLYLPKWEKYQTLRSDRYKPSGIPKPDDNQPTTNSQPKDGHPSAEVSKRSKRSKRSNNSLSPKERVKKAKRELLNKTDNDGALLNDLIDLFQHVNPSWERLFARVDQRKALDRLVTKYGFEKVKGAIETLPKTNKKKYAPTITTPSQLEDKLGALVAFIQKEGDSGKGRNIISSV